MQTPPFVKHINTRVPFEGDGNLRLVIQKQVFYLTGKG
jgi:hypothetical protein